MKRLFPSFTLSEVLITLGVIGIVAAMTLPTVITSYQKKVTITRLKKAYSVLMQAILLAEKDRGPIDTWSISQSVDEESRMDYGKRGLEYILPYLDGAQLKYTVNLVERKNAPYHTSRPPVNLKGVYSGGAPLARDYAITKDGMYISFGHVNWTNVVPIIQVDINGKAGPNVFGKDIFTFMLANRKSFKGYNFSGLSRDAILRTKCNKESTGRNEECTAVIIMDGWEIKDDYPW